MKQRILERARSTVDGFLYRQCADATLGLLSVVTSFIAESEVGHEPA